MKKYDVCLWKQPASVYAEVQMSVFAENAQRAVLTVMGGYGLSQVDLGWAASDDDDDADFVYLAKPFLVALEAVRSEGSCQ